MAETFEPWVVDYNLDGAQWQIIVMAASADDALRRLSRAATFGSVAGVQTLSVKVAPDWTVPAWRKLRGLFGLH